MPKPFSGKAKKKQLQAKRAARHAGAPAEHEHESEDAKVPTALTAAWSKSGSHNRWSTVLAREDNDRVRARIHASATPWQVKHRGAALVALQPPPPDPILTHPRGVSLTMGAAAYASRFADAAAHDVEEVAFTSWLERIYAAYPRASLNHFEHNMEVWAQLWHTMATADVIAIVADVRNPLWHLPHSLVQQVRGELKKPLVIILNKVDLVREEHTRAWRDYLTGLYPGVAVTTFSSSGASLSGCTTLAARRRAIREARKLFDPARVAARAADVCALLHACGAVPEAIEDVKKGVMATAREVPVGEEPSMAALRNALKSVKKGATAAATPGEGEEDDDGGVEEREEEESDDDDEEEGDDDEEEEDLERILARPKAAAVAHHAPAAKYEEHAAGHAGSAHETDGTDEQEESSEEVEFISDKSARRRERKALKAAKAAGVAPPRAATSRRDAKITAAHVAPVVDQRVSTRKHVMIGMVGHPNAGKSSVINTICAEKRVSVSRTAGHTKRAQNVPLVDGIELLDCPGLIFPHALGIAPDGTHLGQDAENAERAMQELLGVIPIAQVRETFTAIRYLGERMPLESMYGLHLPKDEDAWSSMVFAEALAVKRGVFIAKVGRPDAHAAGREVLYDSQDGVIPLAWLPPLIPAPVLAAELAAATSEVGADAPAAVVEGKTAVHDEADEAMMS